MLTETYEKMLHYAHNLKSPITTLHMLGIILPILGLVILPLVVSFMGGVQWYHIATLYNIALPIGVFYLTRKILASRPTGYGDSNPETDNPEIAAKQSFIFAGIPIPALAMALVVGIGIFLIALTPLILHTTSPMTDYCVAFNAPADEPMFFKAKLDPTLGYTPESCGKGFALIEYRQGTTETTKGIMLGPYGLGASILSVLFPLGLGIAVSIYFGLRTRNLLDVRENAQRLEDEFATALFQLGNRLADGVPAEAAVGRVAESMANTTSGKFFELVSNNIRKLGMGLNDALFHPRYGAVTQYPSAIITSSMKVLAESIRKGPAIAAQSLQNVSRYIKEIHQVNERLRDLMAEIVSDISSQINFMTPAIAGIVIGITSMITTILGKISGSIIQLSKEGVGAGGATISSIASLFGDGIPTYYFQLVVGTYVVQIIIVLTIMANGIQNGEDKLGEQSAISKNTRRSTMLYCAIALTVMLIFNTIANMIVTSQ